MILGALLAMIFSMTEVTRPPDFLPAQHPRPIWHSPSNRTIGAVVRPPLYAGRGRQAGGTDHKLCSQLKHRPGMSTGAGVVQCIAAFVCPIGEYE